LGTTIPSVTANIVYSGESAILNQWRKSDVYDIVEMSHAELLSQLSEVVGHYSTIVLSMFSLRAGRVEIPIDPASSDNTPAFEILNRLAAFTDRPNVILLTQNGTPLELCCQAVRLGVSHFIDTDATGWEARLTHAIEQIPVPVLAARKTDPKALLEAVGIKAVSPAMQDLIVQVYRGAQVSDATVLIHGESGTGKQLLAEAIHRLDPKRGKFNFTPVNCAAITGTLAESELFGHTKGAFSGATDIRLGYFRTANKGTIFLDEISELPLHLQPKLLRVLQEKRVMPVGSDKEEAIDVRVIAATNVSLQEKVAKGEFRLDLYQRLNVIHLAVPPLRQRIEDIPLLVTHFVNKYQHYCSDVIRDIDPLVFELLKRKAGDGNVRELENIIRQSLVFKSSGDRFELSDLPKHLFEAADQVQRSEMIPSEVADHLVALIRSRRLTLKQAVETFEKTLINQASKNSPSLSKVELAKVLGLPRRTLYYKMDLHDDASAGS